jgi:hypothetical protein
MARRRVPESAESKALRELLAEDEDVLQRLVAEAGPPDDSHRLSEADEDAIYAITDPTIDADPDAFATLLLTTGVPQEQLGTLKILEAMPELAQAYAQPTQDAEMADMLTRLAQYPWRASLVAGYADPEEQVRKADALDRRFQKRHGGMVAPEPQQPMMPPSQPMAPAAPAVQMPAMPEQPMAAPPMEPTPGQTMPMMGGMQR